MDRSEEPSRGSSPAEWGAGRLSAQRALDRLVLVMVPLWSAAILPRELTGDGVWPVPLVAGTSALVFLGFLLFIRTRRVELLLGPMVVSLVVLVGSSPPGIPLVYALWIGWLNLICVVIGAEVAPITRAAWMGAATATLTVALSAGLTAAAGQGLAAPELVAIGMLAFGDCMVVALCADVMREAGGRSDVAAARRARADAEVARLRGSQAESVRVTRLLHDTVVNTLGAVARWPSLDRAAVAERCRADLALMELVTPPPAGDPHQLLRGLEARARMLGLVLDQEVIRIGPDLDPAVNDALDGACREALNNVAKHAGVTRAQLTWDWDGRSGRMEIIDHGVGFRSAAGWTGGAGQSVATRCADAGVIANVSSAPGAGTRIALTWSGHNAQAQEAPGTGIDVMGEVSALMARVVLRILLVFSVLGVVSLAATPVGWPMIGTVLTLAMLAALGLAAAAVRDHRLEPSRIWWGIYPLGSLLCTALPSLGMGGCARAGVFWVGGVAGLAFASAATMLDRRPWVVAATAFGYLMGGTLAVGQVGPGASACAAEAQVRIWTNLAAIAAMWALARQLQRTWAAGRAAQEQLSADLARQAHLEEIERIRQDLFGFARAVCEPLMTGLAEDKLNPGDPAVRARCAQAETTLRTLACVRLGDPSGSGPIVAQLLIDAHAADITITMGGDTASLPGEPCRVQVRGLLTALVPACQPGSDVRLTVIPQQTDVALLALIDRPATNAETMLSNGGWDPTHIETGILAEATIPQAASGATNPLASDPAGGEPFPVHRKDEVGSRRARPALGAAATRL